MEDSRQQRPRRRQADRWPVGRSQTARAAGGEARRLGRRVDIPARFPIGWEVWKVPGNVA